MSKKVLIVGCGELGSRHLQAVAQLAGVSRICVYDPRPEALQLGQQRVEQVKKRNLAIKFDWSTDL